MNTIQSTLTHKILPPQEQVKGASPALVLLHGRGANEDDLLGLTEYLDPRLFCIAPRAPFSFEHGGGYTWYDIVELGKPEPKMLSESYQHLVKFYDDILKGYPIDPKKIFFLGFSMGTMMSFSFALTHPTALAGVIASSGYIPEGTALTYQWDKIKSTPFFVAHGLYDPVIPVQMGRRARQLLEQAHVDVTYREYEMVHQISEECLHDMAEWLTKRLG